MQHGMWLIDYSQMVHGIRPFPRFVGSNAWPKDIRCTSTIGTPSTFHGSLSGQHCADTVLCHWCKLTDTYFSCCSHALRVSTLHSVKTDDPGSPTTAECHQMYKLGSATALNVDMQDLRHCTIDMRQCAICFAKRKLWTLVNDWWWRMTWSHATRHALSCDDLKPVLQTRLLL